MQTIKEPGKNISLIWNRQIPTQAVYRPMKYLLKVEVEDGMLLYNVVTSELILLDDKEAKIFESLPAMYSSEMDELIAKHFIVKEDFEEKKSVQQLRMLLRKLNPPKRTNGFTILPTTECNARCYYCFESDHKHCTMTEKIVHDVVDYIAKECKSEPIEIGWFGGEPLVGFKQISMICDELRQKGIKFTSSMVSNAYLFDCNLISVAKSEWNLKRVQITLDGTEKVYNETKAYINPKDNPYLRVIKNISDLLGNGIVVNIRLNVTDRNYEDLSVLIDELAEKYNGNKLFTCYAHAVYDGVGFEPLQYDDNVRSNIDVQTIALDRKLREKGLLGDLAKLPSLRIYHCMSDNESSILIYPDGTIGKCENRPSSECIGDIYNGITDEAMNEKYKATKFFPECFECCLFPDCITLEICPETGQCSPVKQEWKKNRYNSLVKETYIRYKNKKQEENNGDLALSECES